ncbi:hypothetical protein N9344_00345 [bacterium]|nr:hypothetical protein [bacterium]
MGHKNVCFNCRKALNIGNGFDIITESKCPECGNMMTLMTHRFRPPKKSDEKAWEVVKFLVKEGFPYQHIYDDDTTPPYVSYPKTLKTAKEFVIKYKKQRIENKHNKE